MGLRIGIAGLGQAGAMVIPSIRRHQQVELVAAAEPDPEVRAAFARDFRAKALESIDQLCADSDVEAIYVATPTPLHSAHALAALNAGKHVVVEKPMAATLADADAMVAAAESAGRALIVGHSQSFEPAIRAMRTVVRDGDLGGLRMAHNQYYTDWLYRPRTPGELERSQGGGAMFRQGVHQVDLLRWICGGLVHSVRASIAPSDPSRPGDGAHTIFLDFESGIVATAVFSGYDHFNSAELTFGIGESGRAITREDHARARRSHASGQAGGKRELAYGGASSPAVPSGNAGFYGLTIVTCERGDIRQTPDGLAIYGDEKRTELPVAASPGGRDLLLDELVAAAQGAARPLHDGRWGCANLEVCIAAIESSRSRSEVPLTRQVPTPGE